ncbi:MAG: DUF1844 domain-containing protein [Terriglobales bacterium]
MSEHERDNEHEEPVLKVSDRRHFTESGERRQGVDAAIFEESPAAPKPAPDPAAEGGPAKSKAAKTSPPPPPKPAATKRERLASRDMNFIGLLQDLYATGMLQLGAELQPGRPGQVDLEGARETIDLLGMLQEKTHGNLDAQEDRLLTTVLYELRLGFVEVSRASQRVQPATVAPPPPAPGRRR